MAKSSQLGCLEKRDLLNRSAVSTDRLLEWGRIFEQQELINDAVDFYIKAGSSEDLEKLLSAALGDGDVFIYTRLARALGRKVTADEWMSLGKRAAELGKNAYARDAFKKGGVEMDNTTEAQTGPAH